MYFKSFFNTYFKLGLLLNTDVFNIAKLLPTTTNLSMIKQRLILLIKEIYVYNNVKKIYLGFIDKYAHYKCINLCS